MVAPNIFQCLIYAAVVSTLAFRPLEVVACEIEPCITVNNYASHRQDAWWVPESKLVDQEKHRELALQIEKDQKVKLSENSQFPIKGHLLGNGKGDALVYKNTFDGWDWLSDSADFMQISIVTPKPLVGSGELAIGGPLGAQVFYTSGVPAFRDYCVGYATKGKIIYNVSSSDPNDVSNLLFSKLGINKGVWAEISVEFSLVNSKADEQGCGRCIFNALLIFEPRTIPFVNQKITNDRTAD